MRNETILLILLTFSIPSDIFKNRLKFYATIYIPFTKRYNVNLINYNVKLFLSTIRKVLVLPKDFKTRNLLPVSIFSQGIIVTWNYCSNILTLNYKTNTIHHLVSYCKSGWKSGIILNVLMVSLLPKFRLSSQI